MESRLLNNDSADLRAVDTPLFHGYSPLISLDLPGELHQKGPAAGG
jgi:hypothetical protein